MRTLERKKSSAGRMNGGAAHLVQIGNGHVTNHVGPMQNGKANGGGEKTEFDDLISALRTGDVFGENMDKFRRNRKTRASPPRVDRMDSFLRERNQEAGYIHQQRHIK